MQISTKLRGAPDPVARFAAGKLQVLRAVTQKQGGLDKAKKQKVREHFPDFKLRLPNPTLSWAQEGGLTHITPDAVAHRDVQVVFWHPKFFFDVPVPCPRGCGADHVLTDGWGSYLRRVAGFDTTYYVLGYRYRCKGCKGA